MRKGNRVFSDYSLINLHTIEGQRQFVGAMTAFARQPLEVQKKIVEAGITEFTNTDDFPRAIKDLIDRTHLGLQEIDIGYEQFFDTKDFSNTPASGFRVRSVSSGLTFKKRAEGGRASIYPIVGTEAFVGFDTYGGGLEFDQAWFQDQEWWLVEDTLAEFRSAWYRDKAITMFTLIGALGSAYNIAYDTVGATQLDKDINTLNTAASALLIAMATAKYPVTANTPLKVLSPIALKGRLMRALNAQYLTPGIAGASLKVEYVIIPVFSLNVMNAGAVCTDKWFMAVAGINNKLGEKMDLTIFSDFKAEAFAVNTVGWGRYGAYMNSPQWRRLATA